MSPGTVLELILSLSIQVAAVIGVCAWLVRQTDHQDTGHRLWGTCHVMIPCITLAALLLPHLRLLPHELVNSRPTLDIIVGTEQRLASVLLAIWLGGAVLYAAAIVIGMIDVWRIPPSAEFRMPPQQIAGREVKIFLSSRTHVPFCWQIHKPVIVLPTEAANFPEEELSAIIRHELAHLQAGHPFYLFLQRVVEALYWFHPLVWWASRQAALQREFHCDRSAGRDTGELTSYLKSLLRLGELTPRDRYGVSPDLSLQGRRSQIRRRVERLAMDPQQTVAAGTMRGGMVLLAMTAVSVTCLWLPLDVAASNRSLWSPWPAWSAGLLHDVGMTARDYEIDGYRLRPHEFDERSAGAGPVSPGQRSAETGK